MNSNIYRTALAAMRKKADFPAGYGQQQYSGDMFRNKQTAPTAPTANWGSTGPDPLRHADRVAKYLPATFGGYMGFRPHPDSSAGDLAGYYNRDVINAGFDMYDKLKGTPAGKAVGAVAKPLAQAAGSLAKPFLKSFASPAPRQGGY